MIGAKAMTKIPVDYVHEEIWKVSESKEDRKMKHSNWIDDVIATLISILKWTGLVLLWGIIVFAFCLLMRCIDRDNLANQAQCESIGGRYDGEACWYNGSKIDVNKYVEEWK